MDDEAPKRVKVRRVSPGRQRPESEPAAPQRASMAGGCLVVAVLAAAALVVSVLVAAALAAKALITSAGESLRRLLRRDGPR